MMESGTINLIGFVVLVFSILFAYTGTLEECTYRRYIVPAMLLLIAVMILEEAIAAVMLAVSSLLIYTGYKGYGIELIKQEAESKKEKK
jgi:predicted Co/Zn/Cd cation transporter (cation efflux family)